MNKCSQGKKKKNVESIIYLCEAGKNAKRTIEVRLLERGKKNYGSAIEKEEREGG